MKSDGVVKQGWLKTFKNPGSAFRSKPFWAWNSRLEEAELRRQIRVMRDMGMGGFFMHSRTGLATPYLSDEWHGLVNACACEAGKQRMEAWLYDEDRWPSGAAGGLVTRNPKYRQRYLAMEQLRNASSLRWTPDILAVFSARVKGSRASDVRRMARGRRPDRLRADSSLLVFRVSKGECSQWFNGFTYLDTLSHDAVKQFIRITHDSYRKHAGNHFGRSIPGIFTDEPNYGFCFSGQSQTIPWTSSIRRIFSARYGYDLVHHLPELYFDVEGTDGFRARHDYFDCITFLFTDAFARQIGEWCSANNLLFTGHALAEATLASQTEVVGSCMRFYEHMQLPGMDLLTEHLREYHTAKQVSSAARQFGRRWRLTETYGCTGWDCSFEVHKAIYDWQAALGINVKCPHLSWYSMEGEAKRDYPASIFFQSPWWKSYRKVEDYSARINLAMSRGVEVRDLLVIHPVESMWTMCRPGWTSDEKTLAYDRSFAAIRDLLLMEHIDFDYGDEDIIARHGSVRPAESGVSFKVGKASYKAVLVPPLITIRSSTLKILDEFRSRGGLVVFAGDAPDYVDAVASRAARDLAKLCRRFPARGKRFVAALEKSCRRISIADENGEEIPSALYLLREDRDAYFLFICNTGHKRSQLIPDLRDVRVSERKEVFPVVFIRGFAGCGRPLELNPDDGSVTTTESARGNGAWEIQTSLPRVGSRLFLIPKRNLKTIFPPPKKHVEKRSRAIARASWPVTLSEPNNAVLDRPRYAVGRGKWARAMDVLRVDARVRQKLGIPCRGGSMVQPWAAEKPDPRKKIGVKLAYTFDVLTRPAGEMFLAMEQPRRFSVFLNEKRVAVDADRGWWVDPSLRLIPLDPAMLRGGRNELILSCEYDGTHPGLEAVYLHGAFGVKVNGYSFAITKTPSRLRLGDWTSQGLPFYSGSVSYSCQIKVNLKPSERLFLEVPEYKGAAVRVLVNGQEAGIIAWEPNEIDMTDFLNGPVNDLCIEVLGHRRNSHGPLHHRPLHPEWTGPAQFVTEGKNWADAFQLVPCGLMKAPRLSVRRSCS